MEQSLLRGVSPQQAFRVFEKVNKNVDKGDSVGILYLGFQKAFNKVPLK